MTYLITGATGFIGGCLVRQLLAGGDCIHYLGRKPDASFGPQAVYHHWSPEEEPALADIPPCDAVIHLAGEPIAQRWNKHIKDRIYSSRVAGTRNLVSALAKLSRPPKVLVAASAIGYYGNRGDQVLTEEDQPGTGFLAKVCVDWEMEAVKARTLGMRVAPVRVATVLGREGGAFPLMERPSRFGVGATFGDGKQWMSWIHAQDLVDLLLFAVQDSSVDTALNGSSPEPVTNAVFTQALARALHRPLFLRAPKFAMHLLLGEMSSFLFDSLRVIPATVEQLGFGFRYGTLAAALDSLVGR